MSTGYHVAAPQVRGSTKLARVAPVLETLQWYLDHLLPFEHLPDLLKYRLQVTFRESDMGICTNAESARRN